MRHLRTFESYISPEEDRLNDILDKINKSGMNSISDYDKFVLQNKGELPHKDKYIGIPDKLEFEYDETEDYGDELKVKGTLIYKDEEYYGWFTIPKTDEHRGQNTWDFFQGDMEFDPEPDDLYELDSMIQEIEFDN